MTRVHARNDADAWQSNDAAIEPHSRAVAAASDYDTFVNWDARLVREAPLFRRVFDEVDARRVIDVGCGSAKHSIMFATWGLIVDAVDPDDSMLAQAEANLADAANTIAEAGGAVRLTRGGFGELAGLGLAGADGAADALVCTGNALPHVAGLAGLREALADFAAVVRPGGVIALHLLNHARLLAAKPRTLPPIVRDTAEGTRVFLRVLDYPEGGEAIGIDFVTMVRDCAGAWTIASRRSEHTALPWPLLAEELEAAGFAHAEAFGDHAGTPFAAEKDESMIVVAHVPSGDRAAQ